MKIQYLNVVLVISFTISLTRAEEVDLYGQQYFLHGKSTWSKDTLANLNIEKAWKITKGGAKIRIAVIDVGFDIHHKDLPGRWIGKDLMDGDDKPYFLPDYGLDNQHGTACAGIIFAKHNNVGIRGIAPKCIPIYIRINHRNGIETNGVTQAIGEAVKLKARVISLSLLADWDNNLLAAAVKEMVKANCTVIVSGAKSITDEMNWLSIPGVVVVGSIKDKGTWDNENSGRSSYIDVVAPGVKIVTCDHTGNYGQIKQNMLGPGTNTGDHYFITYGINYWSDIYSFDGTSASTAMVSGVVGLMLSVNPELSPVRIEQIVKNTADPSMHGLRKEYKKIDKLYGYGIINAERAVKEAMSIKSK